IAIVGGGLAGASAAVALSRLPDTQVRVYERAPALRESGAQIAVMVTAVKVLRRMLSPAAWDHLQQVLYRGEGTAGIHHRHWKTGEILATAVSPDTPRHMQEGRASRPLLHKTLMMDVPDGIVEYGREVVQLESRMDQSGEKKVVLHFNDGDTRTADLVVSADGLYSKIRRQYIPETRVSYKGLVAYRKNFPLKLVAHIKDLPTDSSSFRNGPNVVIISRLEPGNYSIAAFLQEPEDFANTLRWEHELGGSGVGRLKKKLAGWHPVVQQVVEALPGIEAYPLQAAKWMENLTRDDCIAFVGDAAHPTAGGWGTGSAFCFADVWALYRSLHRTHTSRLPTIASNLSPGARIPPPGRATGDGAVEYNVPYALNLFNETRRHFLQRVERQFEYDRADTAYIIEAIDEDDEFVRRYQERYTVNWWILEHDVDARWQEV
ncbi:FAD/NAD(P)-binding domain-containing protein, partial [Thozetella sp. PMI_491]